ncbi:magnesium transporter [Natranaerobius trueperi]|uniref:Magnesium transporter MgtE n=1 Tax=Natranaerobius trueperi TaxID=759412 RepID=A0A226C2H7_9FIRM|nr:magnesium transporter [Natranaerobius trueperi]OWZ84617.1 magnesium transporter [Natranaerobius trueperi]
MPILETVQNYLENKNMENLKKLLMETDMHDLVQLFKELTGEQRALIFRLLDKDRAIEVFELLDVTIQQSVIESFQEKNATEVFTELDPDDQAKLLDELPAKIANKLMSSLPKEDRAEISELLGYTKGTAGRIMTPEFVSIKKDQTIQDALEKIKSKGENKETIYTIYVTNNNRKLEGVVSLRDLVMTPSDHKVAEIVNSETTYVYTNTDQEEASRILKDRDLLSIPAVDKEERLVGIITVDDAMDILEEENTEDLFERVGLTPLAQEETGRSLRLLEGSLPQIWQVRLPFLLITLIGGLLAGVVMEAYEETLDAIAPLAFFIPVIMDMGGNVGTQSSTIFTRSLVLGHINPKCFLQHWVKEIGVGISMGALLGIAAGFIAEFWQPIEGIGLVVGLSLGLTVTIATALGFLIPFILVKLGLDQAAGSDPFLTTIKDISGLFIYFTLTNIFLGHLL